MRKKLTKNQQKELDEGKEYLLMKKITKQIEKITKNIRDKNEGNGDL